MSITVAGRTIAIPQDLIDRTAGGGSAEDVAALESWKAKTIAENSTSAPPPSEASTGAANASSGVTSPPESLVTTAQAAGLLNLKSEPSHPVNPEALTPSPTEPSTETALNLPPKTTAKALDGAIDSLTNQLDPTWRAAHGLASLTEKSEALLNTKLAARLVEKSEAPSKPAPIVNQRQMENTSAPSKPSPPPEIGHNGSYGFGIFQGTVYFRNTNAGLNAPNDGVAWDVTGKAARDFREAAEEHRGVGHFWFAGTRYFENAQGNVSRWEPRKLGTVVPP